MATVEVTPVGKISVRAGTSGASAAVGTTPAWVVPGGVSPGGASVGTGSAGMSAGWCSGRYGCDRVGAARRADLDRQEPARARHRDALSRRIPRCTSTALLYYFAFIFHLPTRKFGYGVSASLLEEHTRFLVPGTRYFSARRSTRLNSSGQGVNLFFAAVGESTTPIQNAGYDCDRVFLPKLRAHAVVYLRDGLCAFPSSGSRSSFVGCCGLEYTRFLCLTRVFFSGQPTSLCPSRFTVEAAHTLFGARVGRYALARSCQVGALSVTRHGYTGTALLYYRLYTFHHLQTIFLLALLYKYGYWFNALT